MKASASHARSKVKQKRQQTQGLSQSKARHNDDDTKRLNDKLLLANFWEGVCTLANVRKRKLDIVKHDENFMDLFDPLLQDELHISGTVLFDPASMYKVTWDIFIACIIVYSVIVLPYRVGFQVTINQAVDISDYVIDAFFLLDILASINTAYVDEMTERLVLDRKKIMYNYLQLWFWIDLVSTIPIDKIVERALYEQGDTNKIKTIRLIRVSRIVRLTRLIKLARVIKFEKLFKRLEVLQVNPTTLNVFKLVLQIFFVAHLISCIWFYLTTNDVTGDFDKPNLVDDSYTRTWATESGIAFQSVSSQYVASLYWTITTMVAVGYGDIHAINTRERIFSIFTELCGGIMFGAVISQVTKLIASRNPQAKAFKEKMNEIKAYLGEKTNLPQRLFLEAKNAYAYYLQRKSLSETDVLISLPKPLLHKLVRNVYDREISKIKMLRTFDRTDNFVTQIIIHSKPFQAIHGELLYEPGDIAQDILFTQRGLVRIAVQNGVNEVTSGYCTEGGYFGDFEYHLRSTRIAYYHAATSCNLFSISYSVIKTAIDDNYDSGNLFLKEMATRLSHFQHVNKVSIVPMLNKENQDKFVDKIFAASRHNASSTASGSKNSHRYLRRKNVDLRDISRDTLWVDGHLRSYHTINSYVNSIVSFKNEGVYRVISLEKKELSDEYHAIIKEETIYALAERFIIHPAYPAKYYWDLFVGLLIAYSIIAIPLQMGFGVPSITGSPLDTWETLLDVLFFVDILICFRTSFYSEEDDAYVTMPGPIVVNYVKGWFFIDLLSSIPFDKLIDAIIHSSASGISSLRLIKSVRLTRLLKLARFAKLSKYTGKLEDIAGISPIVFELLTMIVEVLFIGHIIACVWWAACTTMSDQPWYTNTIQNALYHSLKGAELIDQYVASLYWTFTTLATVGYGDITSVNTPERILNIFIMMLGVTVFGYIVANVSSLMDGLDYNKNRINERVTEISEFLNEKNCPKILSKSILSHYKHMFNQSSVFDEVEILGRLPFRIRNEILLLQHAETMKNIRMLKYIDKASVQMHIFQMLTVTYYGDNQYLVKQDELASEILFLTLGRARIHRTVKRKAVRKHLLWTRKRQNSITRSSLDLTAMKNEVPTSVKQHNSKISIKGYNPYSNSSSSSSAKKAILNRGRSMAVVTKLALTSQISSKFPEKLCDCFSRVFKHPYATIYAATTTATATTDIGVSAAAATSNGSTSEQDDADYSDDMILSDMNRNDHWRIETKNDRSSVHTTATAAAAASTVDSKGAGDDDDGSNDDDDGDEAFRQSRDAISAMGSRGREFMGDIKEGDFIGYRAMMVDGGRHHASAKAIGPCTIYSLSKYSINDLGIEYPSIFVSLQNALALAISEQQKPIKDQARVKRGYFISEMKQSFENKKRASFKAVESDPSAAAVVGVADTPATTAAVTMSKRRLSMSLRVEPEVTTDIASRKAVTATNLKAVNAAVDALLLKQTVVKAIQTNGTTRDKGIPSSTKKPEPLQTSVGDHGHVGVGNSSKANGATAAKGKINIKNLVKLQITQLQKSKKLDIDEYINQKKKEYSHIDNIDDLLHDQNILYDSDEDKSRHGDLRRLARLLKRKGALLPQVKKELRDRLLSAGATGIATKGLGVKKISHRSCSDLQQLGYQKGDIQLGRHMRARRQSFPSSDNDNWKIISTNNLIL